MPVDFHALATAVDKLLARRISAAELFGASEHGADHQSACPLKERPSTWAQPCPEIARDGGA